MFYSFVLQARSLHKPRIGMEVTIPITSMLVPHDTALRSMKPIVIRSTILCLPLDSVEEMTIRAGGLCYGKDRLVPGEMGDHHFLRKPELGCVQGFAGHPIAFAIVNPCHEYVACTPSGTKSTSSQFFFVLTAARILASKQKES